MDGDRDGMGEMVVPDSIILAISGKGDLFTEVGFVVYGLGIIGLTSGGCDV